jgi:hypothetical protein
VAASGQVYRRCGCTDPDTGRAYQSGLCPRLGRRGHGSWYFGIDLPGTAAGGRRRVRRGGYRSRRAAVEALSRLRTPDSAEAAGRVLSVSGWLDYWLASRTSQRASTLRGYRSHVRVYLTPYLGRIPLAELTVGQVPGPLPSLGGSSVIGELRHSVCAQGRVNLVEPCPP